MKYKSNKTIFTLIVGLTLVGSIIGFQFLNNDKNKETSSYTQENELVSLMKNKTLTEIMKESNIKEEKGPIPSSDKKAYITIDDGPSKYTNDILDILAENDVKATFFMLDGNMKKYPESVERIYEDGNSAGFHSVTHDVKELYKNPQSALNEFETCKETFYEITGEESKLIRIPYGSKPYMPESSYELLEQSGYKMWDWNLDTQDWRATTDNIVSNILYYGRDNPNLVILMHEKEQTVEALSSMIKVLKERGYDILPIKEDMQERNFWDRNL